MSVLVWDGRTLASDRLAENGGRAQSQTKMKRLQDGRLVGWVGCLVNGMALVKWLEGGAHEDQWPEWQKGDDFTRIVVINPDGTGVEYENLPTPLPVQYPDAWGSGRDYALAAMEMGADARRAVEVASKFNVYCGLGVDTFDVLDPAEMEDGISEAAD